MIELSRAKGSTLKKICLGGGGGYQVIPTFFFRFLDAADQLTRLPGMNAWVGLWQRVNLGLACFDEIGHSLLFQECLKWKVGGTGCRLLSTCEIISPARLTGHKNLWKSFGFFVVLKAAAKLISSQPLVQICAFLVRASQVIS
jgi:hypothetical protein